MKTILIASLYMCLFATLFNASIGQSAEKMTEANPENGFFANTISAEILSRMHGKSYPAGCVLPIDDLRYLQVLHYGFDGQKYKGEIIVNKIIAQDVLSIFQELYEAKYPIEKMHLIDNYNAHDETSMTDNNSSGFCFRNINNTQKISNHAKGLAIDINPLYNPYIRGELVEPAAGRPYAFNREGDDAHFIKDKDICVTTFAKYGFTWGGYYTDRKDYQHFEKVIKGLYQDIESAAY